MTDRPILFSGPMVRAILEGRKTQTRRVIKHVPFRSGVLAKFIGHPGMPMDWHWCSPHVGVLDKISQPYTVGDRLFPAMEIPSLNRNYCADLHGNIWSRARDENNWMPLKGVATSNGYLTVTPAHQGRYETRLVHRLVAEAFYGYQPYGLWQVRHLNGDQRDNAPENLDWGTQEDNWSDRAAHGRASGEKHHAAKLTKDQAEEIRRSTESQRELAARFNIAQSTVWAIKSGRYWQSSPKQNAVNCPRWASRLTPIVTDVRVQRLQDISEADAMAEGADWGVVSTHDYSECGFQTGFHWLWDSINAKREDGAYAWDANPWVVAVTFEPHQVNIDEMGGA